MKLAILAILLVFIGGCSIKQDGGSAQNDSALVKTIPSVSGTQELLLNEQDLQQLGMRNNGTDCQTEEYPTNDQSPLAQYSICYYTINRDNTQVVIELQKFSNYEALNGSYQYQSSHYFGAKGIISENDFGDQSKFHVNNEDDYGAQFNPPGVYYYHLYITKDLYLIHITSAGSDAKEYVAKIGRLVLSKFG